MRTEDEQRVSRAKEREREKESERGRVRGRESGAEIQSRRLASQAEREPMSAETGYAGPLILSSLLYDRRRTVSGSPASLSLASR